MPRSHLIAMVLAIAFLATAARADEPDPAAGTTSTLRTLRASRVEAAPRIDGRLDDPAWQGAEANRGFVQRSPVEGAPPTDDTEVRFVYDADALYVSFRCFDQQASQIASRLGRRDEMPASDWVSIAIDAYFDRKTALMFQISASGVIADASVADGAEDDFAWDASWTGEVRVDAAEWTAELRIPFAALRFPGAPTQTWGVHVKRFQNRTQEISEWNLIGSGTSAYVASFAPLVGIAGIAPGLNLSLLPYGLVGLLPNHAAGSVAPRRDYDLQAGLDAKYAVTGQLTLDATLNPDFGQVEVDPSVINLSAIETFYAEKRPFFTERAEIFRTPLLLLHTRRVGAPPPPAATADTVISEDTLAPIYGAAKLTGRIGAGTSVGLLSALVGPTTARVDDGVTERDYETSPLGHFGAVRIRHQVSAPYAFGALVTMVQRFAGDTTLPSTPLTDHYVGAADVDLRRGPYSAVAQVAASSGTCDEEGSCVPLGGTFTAGRTAGERFRLYATGTFLTPDFDYNNTGYMESGDLYKLDTTIGWNTPKPWGPSLSNEQALNLYYGRNHAGDTTALGIVHTAAWKWKNLWETSYELGIDLPRYDTLETRGGIPFHRTSSPYGILSTGTNASRALSTRLDAFVAEESGGYKVRVGSTTTLLAGSRLQLQLALTYRGIYDLERWVETTSVDDVDRYIFNRITYHGVDSTLGATGAVSRRLTMQVFTQLLHVAGKYPADGYRELTDPETLSPIAFAYTGDADFTFTSLLANVVVRWEYRPLSTLYFVWTHASSFAAGSVPGSTQQPGTFDFGDALGDLADVAPSDVVMVKLSYLYTL